MNEEFISFNKAIAEEVVRARAQLKLDMIRLRKELDEQEKREIAAAKQRYLDELAAKKEQGNAWKSQYGGQTSLFHWLLFLSKGDIHFLPFSISHSIFTVRMLI